MPSFRSKVATWVLRRTRQFAKHIIDDLPRLRAEKAKWFSRFRPPRSVMFELDTVAGLPAEWCTPAELRYPDHVLYYLHGGGYASLAPNTHRGLIGKLSQMLGMRVLAIDYRLAPEHPYPAALDDSMAAYRWLIDEAGFDPKRIIISGDSAGGGLSLSTLLKIRELGLPQPLTAFLMSPWADLTISGDSAQTDHDPLLPLDAVREWATWYAGDTPANNPYISPVFADLNDLPPMLVHVGNAEILLDDSIRLAANAEKSNTALTLDVWDGMFHVWHMGWAVVPEARQALIKGVEYLEARIAEHEAIAAQNTK